MGDRMRTISHFINGQSVTRAGAVTSPVYEPSSGQVQATLEHGDATIVAEAVAAARAAQPAWAANNPQRRARVTLWPLMKWLIVRMWSALPSGRFD